jgi:O-antigen ligase
MAAIFQWRVGINWTPDRVALVVLLLTFLVGHARLNGSQDQRSRSKLGVLIGAFAAVAAFSAVTSGTAIVPGAEPYRHLSTIAVLAIQPLLAYWISSRLRYVKPLAWSLLYGLMVIGVYLGFTGIFEHYGISSLVFPSYIMSPEVGIQFGRARGPFVSSTVNGGILLITFAAACAISSHLEGHKRNIALLLTMPIVAAIYFTDTRSIWVSFGVILATMAFLQTRLRRPTRIVGSLILLVFLTGVGSKFSFFEKTLFSDRQDTIEYRFSNYATAYNMVKNHPVFGIGWGKFGEDWRDYFVSVDYVANLEDGNHSTLLGILAELGIVGFLPYVAMLATAFWLCVAAYRRLTEKNIFERTFVVVAIASLEAFALIGITSDLRFHQLMNVIVFLLVGQMVSLTAAFSQGNTQPQQGYKPLGFFQERNRLTSFR